jgi:hypothetical protein
MFSKQLMLTIAIRAAHSLLLCGYRASLESVAGEARILQIDVIVMKQTVSACQPAIPEFICAHGFYLLTIVVTSGVVIEAKIILGKSSIMWNRITGS